MAKPLKVRLQARPKAAGKRPKSVAVKTVSTEGGEKRRLYLLDANSDTFGEDFLYVFSRNVERARAATRALRGAGKGTKDRRG
ncbi:MAG TPA: hypothetical protein VGS12_11985 [Caulobacteraceae bacterium]|nr:hypothetical protein [Caulobacteraceae bacterium]